MRSVERVTGAMRRKQRPVGKVITFPATGARLPQDRNMALFDEATVRILREFEPGSPEQMAAMRDFAGAMWAETNA